MGPDSIYLETLNVNLFNAVAIKNIIYAACGDIQSPRL